MDPTALAIILATTKEPAPMRRPPHPNGYEVPGCVNYELVPGSVPNTWRTHQRCDRDDGKVQVEDLVDPTSRYGPSGGGGAAGE